MQQNQDCQSMENLIACLQLHRQIDPVNYQDLNNLLLENNSRCLISLNKERKSKPVEEIVVHLRLQFQGRNFQI